MYYVYILQGDTRHYIGYTGNIDTRMMQHANGKTQTTKSMGDLTLLGYFTKDTKTQAIKLERMIKKNGHVDHWTSHSTFVVVNKKLP